MTEKVREGCIQTQGYQSICITTIIFNLYGYIRCVGETANQNPSHTFINRLIDIRIALYAMQSGIKLQYKLYT